MKQPLISVIVPCYNVAPYLEECVQSLMAQTYSNIEVLLVEDGSTDDTGKMCDEISSRDERFIVFHKTNGGLSDARNYGLKKAKGKYVTFIDSDDFVTCDYVEYLYSLVEQFNTDFSMAAHVILKNGKTIYKGIGEGFKKCLGTKDALSGIFLDSEMDLSSWSKLYKKTLFSDIEFPAGKCFEDTATTYRLMMKCSDIAVGGKAVYSYRIRSSSITTTADFEKKQQLIEMTQKMCGDIKQVYPELEPLCTRRLVWSYFSTLNQLLKSGQKKKYSTQLKEIVSFLKNHRKVILSGKEYKKNEKAAIILLSMGVWVYDLARRFAG